MKSPKSPKSQKSTYEPAASRFIPTPPPEGSPPIVLEIYSMKSQLNMALWYIKQVGDISQAKRVFAAACLSLNAPITLDDLVPSGPSSPQPSPPVHPCGVPPGTYPCAR